MSTEKSDAKNKTTIKPDDALELGAETVKDLEPEMHATAIRGGNRSGGTV